jgi:hypothetical protein
MNTSLPRPPAALAGALILGLCGFSPGGEDEFYLPENLKSTIARSALDSATFTLERCLVEVPGGRLAARSSFVDEKGEVMGWHDFGPLEGPGWAANAVGGAYEIFILSELLHREAEWKPKALAILDHVLEDGFIDPATGFITPYRHTGRNELVLNFKANRDWFCPGSMAKVAFQLILFADRLGDADPRAPRMRAAAKKCAEWILTRVKPVENGWFPRRCTPAGEVYRKRAEGGEDPLWQTSADGLFIVQLLVALSERGLGDYRREVAAKAAVLVKAGGIFGSINHDTYDAHENVAYSVAFRTLRAAARLLQDEQLRKFAYDTCLAGLDRFKMKDDRNGCATRGLLWMEASWDTAYLWESAEAALAFFEAAVENRRDRDRKFRYERDGLTILRAIARHHHGEFGFLTEGVDWNNHVGARHHFEGKEFGDIKYTEPFLNNLHIIEPTVYYLKELAIDDPGKRVLRYRDLEGNIILRVRTDKGPAGAEAGSGEE